MSDFYIFKILFNSFWVGVAKFEDKRSLSLLGIKSTVFTITFMGNQSTSSKNISLFLISGHDNLID